MDLNHTPRVLDGGLGTLLEANGHDLSDSLWSGRLLRDEPDAIRAAHREFFEAGADVAITASYQVGFERFARAGVSRSETKQLLRRSVELASEASRAMPNGQSPRLVAASVGPYGATLGDGSEYHGASGLSRGELLRWHTERFETLLEAEPDLIAIETIPSLDEATALTDLVSGSGVPAWLSFTVRHGRLRSGEPLEVGFALVERADEYLAVGINCSSPGEVPGAIAAARAVTDKAIVVYPNSGEEWDAQARIWRGSPGFSRAGEWRRAGATLIGGCCRVGPVQIAGISRAIAAGET